MGARCSQSEDSTCAKERARRELVANAKLRAANAADGTNPCGLGRQGACNPASASFTTHRFLSRAPQRALEAPRGALAAAQWVVREQRRRASRFGSSAGRHHRARAHGRCTLHGDTARRVPGCAPRALRRAHNILSDCIFSRMTVTSYARVATHSGRVRCCCARSGPTAVRGQRVWPNACLLLIELPRERGARRARAGRRRGTWIPGVRTFPLCGLRQAAWLEPTRRQARLHRKLFV